MSDKKEIINKITPLVENTLMRFGFMPVEIDFVRENNKDILKIFIYSNTKPVTLDDCEKISRSLDEFLDELIDFKYSLEVSSPGLTRKLKSEKEYLIFVGKIVSIKTKTNDVFPNYKVEGKILDYNEEKGVLIEEVETKKEYYININDIKSSNLVFK
ncbi:MAG: hypothetical protein MRZ90_08785 [Candidatus Gastranaerophilales bacterium]|nr:hypothetical protein [Candidatus Gastranaerophilales bacterium]